MKPSRPALWLLVGFTAVSLASGGAALAGENFKLFKGSTPLGDKVPRRPPSEKQGIVRPYSSVLHAQAADGPVKKAPGAAIAPMPLPKLPDFEGKNTAFGPSQAAAQTMAQPPKLAPLAVSLAAPQPAVTSPCGGGLTPIYKNMKFSGCRGGETAAAPAYVGTEQLSQNSLGASASAAAAPAPGTFPENPAAAALPESTCESQGKFTYFGEDRPGLLYGMCIECTTEKYLKGGGRCG